MAAGYSAIANGGVMHKPHVLEGESDPGHRIISQRTAGQVAQMLEGVLAAGGTAQEASVPGYELAGVERERAIIELLSQRPVVAIAINHEEMEPEEIEATVGEYETRYGVATADPLVHGVGKIVDALESSFPEAFS